MNESNPIYQAIDFGGGQCCDIPGILRELDKAGFVIVPKVATPAMLSASDKIMGGGIFNSRSDAEIWEAMVEVANQYAMITAKD